MASPYRFLRCLLRDPAAAEDLTQHTFLRTWDFTIARRLAVNWLARADRATEVRALTDASDPSPSPEHLAAVSEEVRRIARALARLSHEDAEAVLPCKFEGFSYEELGEVAGCSGDAAKMRVHRALKRLALLLRE